MLPHFRSVGCLQAPLRALWPSDKHQRRPRGIVNSIRPERCPVRCGIFGLTLGIACHRAASVGLRRPIGSTWSSSPRVDASSARGAPYATRPLIHD